MLARSLLALLFVLAGCERKPPHAEGKQPRPSGPREAISVTVNVDGMTTAAVEDQVIRPIEAALPRGDGIEDVRAIAYPDRAIAVVELTVADPLAFVQRAVDGALVRAPDAARKPTVQRGDAIARPALWLALQGQAARFELSRAATAIAGRLRSRPGVRDVELRNAAAPTVIIRLDPARLDAYGTTVDAIARVVAAAAAAAPPPAPGSAIEALAAAELGRGVRIRDVARVELTAVAAATTEPVMLGLRLAPETTAAAIRDAARAIERELATGWSLAEIPPPFGMHTPAFTIAVRGPTWPTVAHLAAALLIVAREHPELATRAGAPRPLDTAIDRPRTDTAAAERAGVAAAELTRAVDAVFGSLGRIDGAPIILRVADHAEIEPDDLARLRVAATPPAPSVPLSALVAVTREPRPIISRHNGDYEAEVFADPIGARLPGPAAAALIDLLGPPPPDYRVEPVLVLR